MKKGTKILFLMIVVSIMGISMPTVFSIGGGQHQFIQIDPNNPDEFCEKCHMNGDVINTELMASGNGLYNGGGRIHQFVKCVDCHAVTSRNQDIFTPGTKSEHAAKIPSCIGCHTSGGIGDFMGDVSTELSTTTEAHNQFNDDTACIGCHTSVQVTGAISYTYSGAQTRFGLTIGN